MNKLAIIILGKRNSGKSSTWYTLFDRTIRTGWKKLQIGTTGVALYVKNSSHEEMGSEINEDVFVKNGSFEEMGQEIEEYFDENNLPRILLCAVQYNEHGLRTIQWMLEHGYYLYIQWLNPGYYYTEEYEDYLNFESRFGPHGTFTRHTGKEKEIRVQEIKDFLGEWITS